MIIYCPKCSNEILIEGYFNQVEKVGNKTFSIDKGCSTQNEEYVHYDLYKCLECDVLWAIKTNAITFRRL